MTTNDSGLQAEVAFVTGVVGLCFDSICALAAGRLFLGRSPFCLICCWAPRLCCEVGLDCFLLNGSEAKCFERFIYWLLRRYRALTASIGPVVQRVACTTRAGMALVDLLLRRFFPAFKPASVCRPDCFSGSGVAVCAF